MEVWKKKKFQEKRVFREYKPINLTTTPEATNTQPQTTVPNMHFHSQISSQEPVSISTNKKTCHAA